MFIVVFELSYSFATILDNWLKLTYEFCWVTNNTSMTCSHGRCMEGMWFYSLPTSFCHILVLKSYKIIENLNCADEVKI